jgi:hypothetical protein
MYCYAFCKACATRNKEAFKQNGKALRFPVLTVELSVILPTDKFRQARLLLHLLPVPVV